ncbi:hypothetical protein ACRRTK_017109 [Alexandromys fortis]
MVMNFPNTSILPLPLSRPMQYSDCGLVPHWLQVGINCQFPAFVHVGDRAKVQRAMSMLNHTTITEARAHLDHKFDLMYAKHAILHWFVGASMKEGEFSEAHEDMIALEKE